MDPISLASLAINIGDLAQKIVKYGSLFEHVDEILMLQDELPTLIAFLSDIKNTFLNAREGPPHTAKLALEFCYNRLERVEKELHRHGKLHSYGKKGSKWSLRPWRKTNKTYIGFRESVMLLKDVCTHFMLQQNELELAQFRREVRLRLLETENSLLHQFDGENRRHHNLTNSLIHRPHLHLGEGTALGASHYDIDNDSLLIQQRTLQLENPNSTVFTAVLCPETPEGQPIKFAVARVLLDTGSDVNIISEKYLIEVGLSHLITQIPEDEQFQMSGIEEQGPSWKFERKFASRFFLYSSRTTSTAEFFVTKSSDWDILISQKQYARSAENNEAEKKLLWMSRKKRNSTEEAEQRAFEQRRMRELEALREAYAQRENQKRLDSQITGALPGPGRAWTLDEKRRALMPGSTSTTSGGEGPSSMRMTSMDEQRTQKQKEASIKSGTMQDGSDDGSISVAAENGK